MASKKVRRPGAAHARERARREAGEQRRAALPTPTGGPGHRRPPRSLGPDAVAFLAIDFQPQDDGAWTVRAEPMGLGTPTDGPLVPPDDDLHPVMATFPELRAAWAEALDLTDRFADGSGLDAATIYSLDGDREAWVALAEREGLADQLPPNIVARVMNPEGD